MSIKDRLEEVVPTKAGKSCGMCMILKQLSDEDRELIQASLLVPAGDPKRVTDRQLSDILNSEGYNISFNSVYRHRANHLDKP